ncbi:MAG: ABC transporter permease subunit, partial [Phycisphaerae bacterium]|nr:ABC transporter permease subunit [Phycisphaerae bacterium]
ARIRAPGASLLAAALVLAVMVVPTIYVASRGAFKSIPKTCLDGATALGMTRIGILRAAVLPTVKPALAVGAVLAITRALGETMAVVMVAGNVAAIPRSLFDPVRTLTANIALELPYATGLHRSALFAGGAGLMALTWSLVVLGRCISRAWSGEHND